MGGPVTFSVWPYASTVTVGDTTGSVSGGGSAPIISPSALAFAQFSNDDIDDGTPAGKARVQEYIRQQVENGTFRQADIDRGNNTIAKEVDGRPPPNINGTEVDCTAIHQSFNLGTLITPNTTLGQFINTYVAIPNCKQSAVPEQCGLKPDQIVCNLAHLCLNVWEPIKAKYPNAIITNSLRIGSNVGAGPHGTGQALDMQFNQTAGGSINPAEYFEIAKWIRDNIAYDQLLLEYHTTKGYLTAWIHCSIYAGTGKKVNDASKVMTFMNHSARGQGLHNLAN